MLNRAAMMHLSAAGQLAMAFVEADVNANSFASRRARVLQQLDEDESATLSLNGWCADEGLFSVSVSGEMRTYIVGQLDRTLAELTDKARVAWLAVQAAA